MWFIYKYVTTIYVAVRRPYIAQYDFDGVEEDDLSFKKEDRIIILDHT